MVYVALLRGINVGGNRKVEMAKLKLTFERLALTHVKTFIASGNVIFCTPSKNSSELTRIIEEAIEQDFGFEVKVLLRDLNGISELMKSIPSDWVNDKIMKCDIMFLWDEIDNSNILKQLPNNAEIEDLKYFPGAAVWRIDRNNTSKSKMFKVVGTPLHKQMTVRNPNTVRKIYELMLSAKEQPA